MSSQTVFSVAPEPIPDSVAQPAVPSRLGRVFTKLGLALLGIIFSLIFIEIVYRLVEPKLAAQIASSDRPKRFYLPEESKDKPQLSNLPAKQPGEFRILVLGDSFTYGQNNQVEDAFPARLERRLNMNVKQPIVRVLNWGVKGYSTVQEVDLLKRALRSPELKPDLVLLEITLNDPEIEPYRVRHNYQNKQGEIVLDSWLLRHWHSLRFLVERILNTRSHHEYVNYFFELFNNPRTWDRFNDGLRVFNGLLAQNSWTGGRISLFTHPLDNSYPFSALHDKIRVALHELSIPRLDLFESFRGIPQQRLQADLGRDSHQMK
jgi:hypothetical protein